MTLTAGIFSRTGDAISSSVCETLRRSLSRDPSDNRVIFQDERTYFVKTDIGAFGEPAQHVGLDGSLTLLTGEPLLTNDVAEKGDGRETDTVLIHVAFAQQRQLSLLEKGNGAFSAVHYDKPTGTVALTTDKLGLRPLYFYVDKEYLVFASALRVLEEISEIPKRLDIRAVTQMVGLGYALGERTPYADIHMVRGGEVITVTEKNVSRRKYWHWDAIEPTTRAGDELQSELYRRFNIAVARRIRNDKTTAAYLSGGLDSRCIVAALREQNTSVYTFNFARPHTQDQAFGLQFARAIGAIHSEVPKKAGDLVPDYSSLMAEAWNLTNGHSDRAAERPAIVWSGEGGSVALGHVHLTEKIVELTRTGKMSEAIDEHLRHESAQVSPKIFQNKLSDSLEKCINEDIKDELSNLYCRDPSRNFYFYLLLNDQHRKLSNHFENIDLHRLEFQLPFFDSSFLAFLASIPIDLCLRHDFYVKWLSHSPQAVTTVPWQVYPGHKPCPVPVPDGLDYQWADEYQSTEHSARKWRVTRQASELMNAANFPKDILNKKNLRIASWIHATGLRDYQYLIEPAYTYYLYWQKCGGKYVL